LAEKSIGRADPIHAPRRAAVPARPRSAADAPIDRLAAMPLFSELGADDLARLAHGARLRLFASGEPLWFAGERAAHFAIIETGVVQIRQMTPTGEGVVVGLFRAGEAIGLSAALEHGIFPADALAIGGQVEVLWLRADTLDAALRGSAAIGMAINRALLQHTAALRAKIDIVSAGSVPRRLAALMSYLIERFGHPADADAIAVGVNLNREEIAQLVSARVETVIRILSRWQKAGWLATRAGGFEIMRTDMLQRILETPGHAD
jgi:CRP/FNR family transcriptional regulator, nitrogen oxide reductase regulator